jgi:hypothetical protein
MRRALRGAQDFLENPARAEFSRKLGAIRIDDENRRSLSVIPQRNECDSLRNAASRPTPPPRPAAEDHGHGPA